MDLEKLLKDFDRFSGCSAIIHDHQSRALPGTYIHIILAECKGFYFDISDLFNNNIFIYEVYFFYL